MSDLQIVSLFMNTLWTHCLCTYTNSASHHWCCEFESPSAWSGRGVQHYVIKFISDLWQDGGFLRVLRFTPPKKTKKTRHDITEILLKVALNTIKQTNKSCLWEDYLTKHCDLCHWFKTLKKTSFLNVLNVPMTQERVNNTNIHLQYIY